MAILQIVLDIIIPVFGVLGLGYAIARLGWFDDAATRGVSIYVFRIAIPLMLFRSMALAELPAQFPVGFMAAYFLASYMLFAAGFLMSRRLFGYDLSKQGLFGFGCSYSNLVLIGIPLVLTTWGEQATLPLFSLLAVHTIFLFTPLTAILEIARGDGGGIPAILKAAVKGVVTNQYIAGVLLGLLYNLTGLSLHHSADAVLSLFAASAPPCALFCMGASLSQYRISGEVSAALIASLIKIMVFPALVWFLGAVVFELESVWLGVAVVIAAMPTGVNIYLFAQQYQTGIPLSTTTTVLSTALSIITLTVVLTLLGVR